LTSDASWGRRWPRTSFALLTRLLIPADAAKALRRFREVMNGTEIGKSLAATDHE
jgi:hypothetical protein